MRSELGAARERTQLAWHRSGLAIVATAGATIKSGMDSGHPRLALTAGAALLALAATVWSVGSRQKRRQAALRTVAFASALSAAIALALLTLN